MSLLATEPFRLLFSLLCIIAFVGGNAMYLVLAERKGAGRFQNRPGPNEAGYGGWLQPIADVGKLLSKQILVPPGADRSGEDAPSRPGLEQCQRPGHTAEERHPQRAHRDAEGAPDRRQAAGHRRAEHERQ